ncbi:phosphoglycerate dehydrogenase [uncultured Methanolobus sp.]|uniref:phosphoglycerate dehydrogenase n=1 Tax=uncultured Methanolobus sp. TaxID=218300 RepID=UPI0029C83902|nr:phosphoglycerate dehydrogenase [uncultured Methanolobus sp.]
MKVLISSRSFGKIDSEPIDMLNNAGFEVTVNPYDRKLTERELVEMIGDSVGLIAGTEEITEEFLKNAKSLKVISRYGVGMDNIDQDVATKLGIKVCNTPNAPSKAVAELTLSMILNILRRIPESSSLMNDGRWLPQMGRSLYGKKLGVVGLGRIGKEMVQLVKPFNLTILAYEIYPDNDFITSYGIRLVSLEELLSQSDIISIHLPLMKETYNLIGEKEISLMKDTSILINTARGGLVDEGALANALMNGTIAGAGIDVFTEEPYSGDLLGLDNVLLTPHIGTFTEETRKKMEIETVDNLIKSLREIK